jgi:UDP-glucose 4-epimerase
VGGAGFIGSRFVELLLQESRAEHVTIFDNFSSGRQWHLEKVQALAQVSIHHGDVKHFDALVSSMAGHGTVIHLASNPDIARAATDPDIDFQEGTLLTRNVLEAVRINQVPALLYASGSGVYGDRGSAVASEDDGPFLPISTYGASKLAGEAMIGSYCAMFGLRARAFRFGNVVGPRQTHGVGYDFLRKLHAAPERLSILGDGTQDKPYIHVDDVYRAVMCATEKERAQYQVYNVAPLDTVTVREIAQLAIEVAGLSANSVELLFSGGDRGWKGDVPVVKLNSSRIRELGWSSTMDSRQAMKAALEAMWPLVQSGKLK